MDQQAEAEVLLCCLAAGADDTRTARLARLSTADWDRLIEQSARHRLAPLLYQRLKRLGPGTGIPAGILQALREAYLGSAARSMRLGHELEQVVTALQADDIPVIALKGAHLAEVVYGNAALRPMSDIDLLVRRMDLSRAADRMLEIGYSSWQSVGAKQAHLPPFVKPGATCIEIHWSIARPTSPFRIDVDGLWSRARPTVIAGVKPLVLSPEDLLLHVSLHASFQHRFALGLVPFCDISATLQYYQAEMDWEEVGLRARHWGAGKCAYLTLHLARQLLAAPVPDDVLKALEPTDLDPRFAAWAKERIFSRPGETVSVHHEVARLWGAGGPKLATLLKTVFPPREDLAKLYPVSSVSKRIYLYYPLRLKYLLLRYGRAAWQAGWRLLRRDKEMIAAAERENRANALVDWLASA